MVTVSVNMRVISVTAALPIYMKPALVTKSSADMKAIGLLNNSFPWM